MCGKKYQEVQDINRKGSGLWEYDVTARMPTLSLDLYIPYGKPRKYCYNCGNTFTKNVKWETERKGTTEEPPQDVTK
jgi:hypothetical protein